MLCLLLPGALRDYTQYCYEEYKPKLMAIADACEAAQSNAEADASLDRLASLDSLDSLASLASLASLDKFLISIADVGLGVLVEMKSPGCEWLDLCEVKPKAKQ